MRIYMQTMPDETGKLRFYQLILQPDLLGGWTLVRETGQQGGAGRVRRDHFEQFDEAESALEKLRDAQLKRGYRVVFMQGDEGHRQYPPR